MKKLKLFHQKGVGIMTVTKVVAETAGFALIKNKNQITSYSGYDIIHDESGTHKGKTKISKKVIHKSEVLSICLTAIRCNKELKQVYIRLCKQN
ncbi:MAG: transposase [Ignavibacteria bacterium]|nr:transposase [Ignavibacteria bacterium]